MKFGFIIDNRKCIGCHACTTACKAEHAVPVGVNRTWVKQVEKGTFPHTRRLFSVMRCNHCTDAPCVEICPVEALFTREDGIVDFDNRRCIGCKSCMQACPYDALYIDPNNHTAAKCNYCAHRVDIGLEPACVNVCPEHAIISGDMDDPESEISRLLGREQVTVRKAAKDTQPNLFYINGDEASLNPMTTEKGGTYLWSEQVRGVGHYAKETEKLAFSSGDVLGAVLENSGQGATAGEIAGKGPVRSIDLLMKQPRRVYDAPEKGVLWGWEVPGYVTTKAIAAGLFLVAFIASITGVAAINDVADWWGLGLGLFFLGATGILLIMDLDRPDRFLNVLLRPQWNSWLVKGGYTLTVYGGLLTAIIAFKFLEITGWVNDLIQYATAVFALILAVYTAFLFAQAKGRDFWQSPALVLHMLIHSLMAGGASFAIIGLFTGLESDWFAYTKTIMLVSIVANILTMLVELTLTHPTSEARQTVDMIIRGRYKNNFWWGTVIFGNLLPLLFLVTIGASDPTMIAIGGVVVLIGIYLTEKIWIEAPQKIQLV